MGKLILVRRLILLMLSSVVPMCALQRVQGNCEQGGTQVNVPSAGGQSTDNSNNPTNWQQSFSSCTVTVYLAGTTTLATVYSDNKNTPTAMGNPFTAATDGSWFFYAVNGRYDVNFSGGTHAIPTPFTRGDFLSYDTAAGVEYFADQYLTGSTTGGMQEAYNACTLNTVNNPTGCKIGYANDVTTSGGGTVIIKSSVPVYINMHGHTLTCTNTSGICITFTDQTSFNRTQSTLADGQITYSGSSANVTGIDILNTAYFSIRDLRISGFSTTGATAILLDGAEEALFEGGASYLNTNPLTLKNGANANVFLRFGIQNNTGGIQILSGSGDNLFEGDVIQSNSGTVAVLENVGVSDSNLAGNRFDRCHFENNGDGTANAADISLQTTAGKFIVESSFTNNTFTAGTNGANGVPFTLSATGTPNGFMTRSGNQYNGWTGNCESGWHIAQNTITINDNFSTIGVGCQGDITLNDHGLGSGVINSTNYVVSPIFKSGNSNPAATGTVRMTASDTLTFRNQANSSDLTGLSHDSSDHIVADNGSGAGFLVASKVLLPTYAFGSFPAAPLSGTVIFCTNCTPNTHPCTGSGGGAMAVTYGSNTWACQN